MLFGHQHDSSPPCFHQPHAKKKDAMLLLPAPVNVDTGSGWYAFVPSFQTLIPPK